MERMVSRAAVGAAVVALITPFTIAAAETASTALSEVVVTAQKREQRALEVPISIDSFGTDFVEQARIARIDDFIKFSPGMTGYTYGVSNPRLVIRGVLGTDFGIGGDATLGVYVDDFFIGRQSASVTQLLDVRQVDVLKGPQGALFGRNSTAGVVSIATQRPGNELAGYVSVAAGNLDYREINAAVDLPASERAKFRIAARKRQRDGFMTNVVDGSKFDESDNLTGRVSALLEPNEAWEILAVAEVGQTEGVPPGLKSSYRILGDLLGVTPEVASGLFSPNTDLDPFSDSFSSDLPRTGDSRWVDDQDYWHTYARAVWRRESWSVTSITGYRSYDLDFGNDEDGTPLLLLHTFQAEEGRQFSQEFRVNYDADRLHAVGGVSYLDERVDVLGRAQYDETLYLVGTRPLAEERAIADTDNTGWGVFGDVTYEFTDRLSGSVGVRYSRDEKTFSQRIPTDPVRGFNLVFFPTVDPAFRRSDTWSSTQPRVALRFMLTPEWMTYVTATKGYRSGGYNSFAFQPAFAAETIENLELGVKGAAFDNRLILQFAAYTYAYDDLQVLIPQGGAFIVRNAAEASGLGAELSLTAQPHDTLNLYATLSSVDAEYDNFVAAPGDDRSGNRLARSPRFSGSLGGDWSVPLGARMKSVIRASYFYTSKQYFESRNTEFASQDAYGRLDASVSFGPADDRWSVALFGDNVTDERYLLNAPGLFGDAWIPAPPRQYGVRADFRF